MTSENRNLQKPFTALSWQECEQGATILERPFRFMPFGPTADRDDGALPDKSEYQDFYIVYGECFSVWSEIETRLLFIFMLLLRSPDYEAATSAFYSTTGFRAKLDMVGAAISNSKRLPTELKGAWTALQKTTSNRSQRRNQLAHHMVFFGRRNSEQRKIFLGDPRNPSSGSRLHTHDLRALQDSFVALSQELYKFYAQLEAVP